jgi:hypothetical protein
VTGAGTLHVTRSPGRDKASSSDLYTGSGTAFADRRAENYVRYRYTVTASDPAGNIVERSAFARPLPTLFSPRPGARLGIGSAPRLAWRAVRRARYYNVQLWRDGLKVGSWWPSYARLRVPSRWRLDGEQQRLLPGAYSWYVWPGRGAPRLGRYGPLLGKSTFVIG